MPGYIFADSFGGLGQANLTQEQMRQHAMQQAVANVMAGGQAATQRQQFDTRMEAEADARKQDQALRTRQLDITNQERVWQHERDVNREQLGNRYATLAEDQLNWQKSQPTAQQSRENDLEYNRALMRANTGDFGSPEEVQQMHPTLTPQQASGIAEISKGQRPAIEQAWNVANDAANTLNAHEVAKRYVPIVSKALKEGSHALWPDSDEVKYYRGQLEDWQGHLNTLGPKASRILNDKRLSGLVAYDPEADSYVPAVPSPKWQQQAQSPQAGGVPVPSRPPAVPFGALQPDQPVTSRDLQDANPSFSARYPGVSGRVPLGQLDDQGGGVAPSQTVGTGTSGYTPKHPPIVYDRVNYWLTHGVTDPVEAKRRALAEANAVQGP